jgi:hypothetical protein
MFSQMGAVAQGYGNSPWGSDRERRMHGDVTVNIKDENGKNVGKVVAQLYESAMQGGVA